MSFQQMEKLVIYNEENNLDTDITPFKINSKCILNLNVKHKTTKFEENNIESLNDLEFSDHFLYTTL